MDTDWGDYWASDGGGYIYGAESEEEKSHDETALVVFITDTVAFTTEYHFTSIDQWIRDGMPNGWMHCPDNNTLWILSPDP